MMKSFREIKDALHNPPTPKPSNRPPPRYGDSRKIIDENPDAAIRAYSERDGQELVGSGAYESMDRPGRGVVQGEREDHRVKCWKTEILADGTSPTGGSARPAPGPAWLEGINAGTQVQHTGNKGDQADVGRGRAITY
jgi:hypothetical protein